MARLCEPRLDAAAVVLRHPRRPPRRPRPRRPIGHRRQTHAPLDEPSAPQRRLTVLNGRAALDSRVGRGNERRVHGPHSGHRGRLLRRVRWRGGEARQRPTPQVELTVHVREQVRQDVVVVVLVVRRRDSESKLPSAIRISRIIPIPSTSLRVPTTK